jgi:hypothetical protein
MYYDESSWERKPPVRHFPAPPRAFADLPNVTHKLHDMIVKAPPRRDPQRRRPAPNPLKRDRSVKIGVNTSGRATRPQASRFSLDNPYGIC